MSSIPLFSVIVPIYNVEKYVNKCIQSILNSEYKKMEVILVDDGSSDNCPTLCDEYAKTDDRVIVIHKKNGGLVSARKAGAAVAKGKYIISIDGDDFISEEYFEHLEEILKSSSPDIIICGYHTYYKNITKKFLSTYSEGLYEDIEMNNILSRIVYDDSRQWPNNGSIPNAIWCKVVKNHIFCESIKNIDNAIKIGEDLLLSCLIFNLCSSIYISGCADYFYRIDNDNSLMRKYNEGDIYNIDLVVNALEDKIDEKKLVAFSVFNLMNRIKLMVKSSESYFDFVKKYKHIPRDSKFFYYSHYTKLNNATLFNRLKLWVIQKEVKFAMYLFYKYY